MPRIYRTQKERERFLIREFADHLGYAISSPCWQERPDALLTLNNGKTKIRTAIEITDHFNDTVAGRPSPRTPVSNFWELVEASLVRRFSHRKHLTGISGSVRFDGRVAWPSGRGNAIRTSTLEHARSLAEEIVQFAEVNEVKLGQSLSFHRKDFATYPTMAALLISLRIVRLTDEAVPASRFAWVCADITTGHIAVNLTFIKSSIAAKNKKAVGYENWGKAERKWLLLVAGGGGVSTHAPRSAVGIDWGNLELTKLCKESPYDAIVFWERIGRWHRWLKQ